MSKEANVLFEEIRNQCWPGFYLDLNGSICCAMNGFLITVFINTCTNKVEITLDSGDTGFYENNIFWESVADLKQAAETVRRFGKYCYK